MKKTALSFLVLAFILILLLVPAVGWAESMPGMDMGEGDAAGGAAPAAEAADHRNYKPPEQPADDTAMAAIVSGVFGLPIAGWLVARSLRKAKKNSK